MSIDDPHPTDPQRRPLPVPPVAAGPAGTARPAGATSRRRGGLAGLFGAAALVLLAVLWLKSCGDQDAAKSTTCRSYLAMTSSKQSDTIDQLLSAHHLSVSSIQNQIGAARAVSTFCVRTGNSDRAVDDAADWSSRYW